MKAYGHLKLEKKWQAYWDKNKTFQAHNPAKNGAGKSKKPKYYSLIEFPYPSGDGLHVGHPRPYIGMDVISRKRRLEGYNVLYPIGWDAFGLPTENYAIKTGKDPRLVTKKNSENFKRQIKSLGISFDWSREVNTTDPKYYKWTQWIFLQFLKKGLAYKAKIPINWCPKDKIGLANEEVVAGLCERCGTAVEKREKEQWMLGITKYAERLDKDLETVDYLPHIKLAQKNWIGQSLGAEIDFPLSGIDEIKKIIILHGRHGRPDNYNYPWLKKELEKRGYEVEMPLLPNTMGEPDPEEQASFVQKKYKLDEKTALVCHSLGGIVAMRLLERGEKVGRVTLVATPFSGKFKDNKIRKSVTAACKKGFDFNAIKKNAKTFTVLYDETDSIVPEEDAYSWQKNLSGTLVRGRGNAPHFCGETEPDMIFASLPAIRVFTTRPDTIFGATFLAVAPEIAKKITGKDFGIKTDTEKENKPARPREASGAGGEKIGKDTGLRAINPANGEEIPVWAVNYVSADYGTGAIMAVPAHDERDYEFAKKFGLPIRQVVAPVFVSPNSPPKNGLPMIWRNATASIVRNPKNNKYLCLQWKVRKEWRTFVTGGIEQNEDPIEAARREIREETGYKNLKLIGKLSFETHEEFFHLVKNENRHAAFHCLAFELEDESQDEISEKEKQIHEPVWVEESRVSEFVEPEVFKFFWRTHKEGETAYAGEGILLNSGKFNGMDSRKARKEIIKFIGGREKTTFKLRDWVFSRQRYWGEPIPVVVCDKCGTVPVPERDLPVELPKVKNYLPTDSGESPLANISKWVNTKCPKCKGKARRETDTMPNWAGSSWYYLRYADPKNSKALADKKALKYWTPVDWYNGGNEHTTLHLLYSRFWHKFLYDLKLAPTPEPYKKRTSHGMILGEGGEKMSKSRGNVVNPDDVVKRYGADTLRLYEMFMGPFDQAIAWSEEAIVGPRRFLEKVWRVGQRTGKHADEALKKLLHKTIKKVSEDIDEMRFNTAVSAMMVFINEAEKSEISKDDFKKFLQILSPFAPHLAEELWQGFGEKKSISLSRWPKWEEGLVRDAEVKIAVQVNGKVRAEIMVGADDSEESVKQKALAQETVSKYVGGKPIRKAIYVKARLINIVL